MNSGLKRDLLFGYGLVFLLFIVGLLAGTINQVELWNTCNRLKKTYQQNVMAAENIVDSISELNNLSFQYAINSSNQLSDEIGKSDIRFSEWMKLAGENTSNQNEKDILSNIENDYSSFQSSITRLTNIDDEKAHNRMDYYVSSVLPLFIKVKSQCTQLREIHNEKLSDAIEKARTLSIKGIAFIVVFGIAATVIGICIWVFLAKLRL